MSYIDHDSAFYGEIQEMSADLKINGYRPGKVPPEVAQTYLSPVEITERAAFLALEKTFLNLAFPRPPLPI